MSDRFPLEEFEVMSDMVKMFTEPMLEADTELLAQIWEREETAKRDRAQSLDIDRAELRSDAKFQALLETAGVEIEYKDGKNGLIPCFAKSDQFMKDLQDDIDPHVRALAEARIGESSTLMQTRAERMAWMASRGKLCVYLNYAGAGTLRPSGGDKMNWLNLKRNSDLRKAIMAPDGYLLGPCDASQIEVRVAAVLAGEERLLRMFRDGQDPYIDIASEFYGEKIYKPKKGDPREVEMSTKRGAGKQAILMCQYGAAAKRYRATAKAGTYGPPIDMSLEEAERHVSIYRQTYPAICARPDRQHLGGPQTHPDYPEGGYWSQCSRMLARIAGGDPVQWGPFLVKNKRLYHPGGAPMIYDTLEFYKPQPHEDVKDFERRGYWRVRTRSGYKTMHGPKLLQNQCESVSRLIVTQAQIRCARMGYRALNHPYDELLFLIPDDGHAEEHLERCRLEMCKTPTWLPGITLDADASLGKRYSK